MICLALMLLIDFLLIAFFSCTVDFDARLIVDEGAPETVDLLSR
jgi:hypothetical protein